MRFNHRQRLSALGHILALIAAMLLGYVSFLGLAYMRGGRIVESALEGTAAAVILFVLCVSLQRLKGTSKRFGTCIVLERVMVVVLAVACLAIARPFIHFFGVFAHEKEVSSAFRDALSEVSPMFAEYEEVAEKRIEAYDKTLRKAGIKAKSRKKYGLDRHSEGKPIGGDTIVRNNMVSTLRTQLLSPTYYTLRKEALEWTAKAEGATTWNVFLTGNAREIRKAMEGWQTAMSASMTTTIDRPQASDSISFVSSHCQSAADKLDRVVALCSADTRTTPLSIFLLLACWLLLYFPYWLQQRHSKSWETFLPGWLRGKLGMADRMAGVHTLRMFSSKDHGKTFAFADTEASRFRRRMEERMERRHQEPFGFILEEVTAGRLDCNKLVGLIAADHNLIDIATLRSCLENGLLTREQLIQECGMDEELLQMVWRAPESVMPDTPPIQQLTEDTTEVYMWGIPSSGKTCALGALLAAIREGKTAVNVDLDEECQGYEYQKVLSGIFTGNGDCCMLPGRTPVKKNFAIGMTLDDAHGWHHPITLVDMAGELFCTIVWRDNHSERLVTDKHQEALAEFEKILVDEKSEHQKLHVFIIEYGAEDKRYEGFDQDTYLECGLQFLEEKNVLRDATQAMYVLVTKTDQVKYHLREGETADQHLADYLWKYYGNFFSTLDSLCHKYDLCGGHMPNPIPFDIGEVCFGSLCKLDTSRANDVLRMLMARSKGFRSGWRGKLQRVFDN